MAPMTNSATQEGTGDLGVTIKSETNAVLTKIKKKTGLSKSMLANIGLAFLGKEILDGRIVVVNGEMKPTDRKAA